MESTENKPAKRTSTIYRSTSNGIYGLAMIGALVYYLQHATSFWMGALGVLKALLWPAFLIYDVLGFLKA